MGWCVVYEYSWYNELYASYATKEEAEKHLFIAKRSRPSVKVKVVQL
jgi:hypothetical protein